MKNNNSGESTGQKYHFNVMSTSQGAEVTIREGEALPVHEPNRIEIAGTIKAVNAFLQKRYTNLISADGNRDMLQQVYKDLAVITVNEEKGTILLEVDPNNPFGTEVLGKLETNPDLAQFNINKNGTFRKQQFINILKFAGLFFDSAEAYEKLLEELAKLKTSVSYANTDVADDRGNKDQEFVKKVKTTIPTDFVLNMPIYKGFPAVRFTVKICLDVTEGSAIFWLESVELHNILRTMKEEILKNEIKDFADLVVIYE